MTTRPHGHKLIRLVYAVSAIIIVLFVGSNIFLLTSADNIAETVRRTAEENLVRNEIDRQIEIVANDQSQISYWDETVRAFAGKVDDHFVETEIARWLWDDFHIHTTVVVASDGTPRVTVVRDQRMANSESTAFIAQARDLIAAARSRYMAARERAAEGYVIRHHPVRSTTPLYVADIREVRHTVGIVVAQAIVPDNEATLPDGPPQLLLTFKPLGPEMLASIAGKLGLSGFAVVTAGSGADLGARMAVRDGDNGDAGVEAIWEPASPTHSIWSRALPYAALAMLVVALALTLLVMRYARALKALQASERENHRLAMHDALTGLANRLKFDNTLEKIVEEGTQERCAVLCIDLDRFKAVNDTWGHHAGDVVITTVAHRIAEKVGKAGMAARTGGDEFIVLLQKNLERDDVQWLCDGIIDSVCEPVRFEGGTASVGASIGVAWWPDDAMTAKTLIRSADEALYRAKDAGRGRSRFAGEESWDGTDRRACGERRG